MSKPLKTPDEFAAAMQQLSAEAEKTLSLIPVEEHAGNTSSDCGSEYPSRRREGVGEPLLGTGWVEGVLLAEIDDG